jgi:hypothetical protein
MKREQGKAQRNLPRQKKAFRSFSGGFWRLFKSFFSPFRLCFKKSLFCPLGGDCTVISDGHARRRLSEKKNFSLLYYIHKFYRA